MADPLDRLTSALADRYTIKHELGRGGMAIVYLAHDRKHDRPVALKVLRPELAASIGAERFLREIRIAAQLTHPNILTLINSGEADGLLYYVMPYVEGESLRDRLDREKQLSIDDAVRITREVADALSYAHSLGTVHRDIKPGNILFEAGHAVVSDFGIARAVGEAGAETLTETGLAVGTAIYMSPEQASGEKDLDARSDLYSLGCVLYEMLGGQPPHTGISPQAILARKAVEPAPSLRPVRASIPEAVEHAVTKALEKVPADRFATASAFAEALTATAPSIAMGRRRWGVSGVLAAVAVLIVIAVVLVRMLASRPITITTSNILHVTSDPGLEFQPAISADGNEVAYVVGPIGNARIVVRSTIDVGSGSETRLGEDADPMYPAWTPDGASLRFFTCTLESCDWKEVGTRGGSVRTLSVPRLSSRYAWSRDGTRVAFAVRDSIFAFAADNGEPEVLVVHVVNPWGPHSLAWSPDGRWIAYVNANPMWRFSGNVYPSSIWIVDAAGGEPVRVTGEHFMDMSPQWLPDSRHLLFVSNRDGPRGVYFVEVGPTGPSGEPRRVPGASDPHSISISADGRKLAYAEFNMSQNIWSYPLQSGPVSIREGDPVTDGNAVIESHDVSPDGRWIVYQSNVRGNMDLYKKPLDGGNAVRLTDTPWHEAAPRWSPDGTEIACWGPREDHDVMMLVPADGGTPAQFGIEGDIKPSWSPDGLQIAFHSGRTGEGRIWLLARDSVGGTWSEATQLTDFRCTLGDWTPDGSGLLCRINARELVLVSRKGEVVRRHDLPMAAAPSLAFPRFSRDGSTIYLHGDHDNGSRGIWAVPVRGGEPHLVVAFDDPSLTAYHSLTVGPEHIYLSVAEYESDIWVMDLEY